MIFFCLNFCSPSPSSFSILLPKLTKWELWKKCNDGHMRFSPPTWFQMHLYDFLILNIQPLKTLIGKYGYGQWQACPIWWFLCYLLSSLFSRVVLPTEAENILPAMGEPAVKRERTTNNAKSWNGIGLDHTCINKYVDLFFLPKQLVLMFWKTWPSLPAAVVTHG